MYNNTKNYYMKTCIHNNSIGYRINSDNNLFGIDTFSYRSDIILHPTLHINQDVTVIFQMVYILRNVLMVALY